MARYERPVRDVKCCDCGAQTTDARLRFSDVIKYGNGLFDPETVSPITCYVCPECGRIIMYADLPERFRVRMKQK